MDLTNLNLELGELFTQKDFRQNLNVFQPVISPDVEEAMQETAEEMANAREAQIKTAEYIADMIKKIDVAISNQNDHINLLKKNNQTIIEVLHNLFASGEDSVIVQKEILKILQDQDSDKDLLKDKSLDVIIQMIFGATSVYLKSKGIEF